MYLTLHNNHDASKTTAASFKNKSFFAKMPLPSQIY